MRWDTLAKAPNFAEIYVLMDEQTQRVIRASLRACIWHGPCAVYSDEDYTCTAKEAEDLLLKIGDGV